MKPFLAHGRMLILITFFLGLFFSFATKPTFAGICANDGWCNNNEHCINLVCQSCAPKQECDWGYVYEPPSDVGHIYQSNEYITVDHCQTWSVQDGSNQIVCDANCSGGANASPSRCSPQPDFSGICDNNGTYVCENGYYSGTSGKSYDCSCNYPECQDVSGGECGSQFFPPTNKEQFSQLYGNNYWQQTSCTGFTTCYVPEPNCNIATAFSNWSACGGAPANTCNNNNGTQSRSVTYGQTDQNAGGLYPNNCIQNTQTQNQACQVTNCSAGYSCTNQVCTTNIYVNVYTDYNHDGVQNGNDVGQNNVTISDNGGNTPKTGSNGWQQGQVIFSAKATGAYNITMTVPAGYEVSNGGAPGPVGPTTYSIGGNLTNNSGNQVVNFYLTPLYQVSGTVFNDVDLGHCYNPAGQQCAYGGNTLAAGNDTAYTGGSHITFAGSTNTSINAVNGAYTSPQTLLSGNYTVTYDTGTTPLPGGYRFSTNQAFTVTVGDPSGSPVCSRGTSSDTINTQCGDPNNGSISGLNFGLTNETAWPQSICGDMRVDTGYSEPIPSTANCNGTSSPYAIQGTNYCAANPGVLFSGGTNPNYGQGTDASTSQMQIGNTTYPEVFVPHTPNAIESSYNLIMDTTNTLTVPPTLLTSLCPNSSANNPCILSENTPGGVYTSLPSDGAFYIAVQNGDNTTQLGTANYTFIVGGDLYLESNISLQSGYDATFISGGDIHVAGAVGENNWNSLTPDIQGFFSADKNFDIDRVDASAATCNTNGQPVDKKLNVKGTVVTNAAGGGGAIANSREGCVQDTSCPALTLQTDPLQILHAPSPIRIPLTFWQELNP